MRAPSVAELLSAWERAYPERPAQRALTLLSVVAAAGEPDVRTLSIGERDARLLQLRERTFGTAIESVAACRECGEKIELRLTTGDVRAPSPVTPPARELAVDGYRVAWRLPTSGEVAALMPSEGLERASRLLEAQCVLGASLDGEPIPSERLPSRVRDALTEAIGEADPQADVELSLRCPACGVVNQVPFDVATFYWDELTAWARETLREVHELASAYGWSERDILAMTSFRRRLYLEMQGA